MKFEKHLKNCGIIGVIYKAKNGDFYLRQGASGTVFARCPDSFVPVSAAGVQDLPEWIDDILIGDAENLHEADLFAAKLPKDGRAKDIMRIFQDIDDGSRRVNVAQADFALIERTDRLRVFDPARDIEDGEPVDDDELDDLDESDVIDLFPALVVMSPNGEVVRGIILNTDTDF